MTVPVIVDSDAGIDDALALLYLLRCGEAEVLALGSVHGNVPSEVAARNLLRTLEIAGVENIPVALGATRPLAQPLMTAEYIHGSDGLGETQQPDPSQTATTDPSAAEQLVRIVRDRPGEVDVLSLGPLTNIALAAAIEPKLPKLVRRLVTMGGAFGVPGNVTPTAEWNIWADPEAAQYVLEAGFRQLWVPLDVTMTSWVDDTHVALLRSGNDAVAQFSASILDYIIGAIDRFYGTRVCHLHDPLAAGIVVDPGLVENREIGIKVDLRGDVTRGTTVGDLRGSTAEFAGSRQTTVAVSVDGDAFRDRFVDVLLGKTDPRV